MEPFPRMILEYARSEVGSGERHIQYEALADAHGDWKVIGEIEALAKQGLVEFGSSPRGCWLTARGRFELADQLVKEQVT